jgi:hypothetical protein
MAKPFEGVKYVIKQGHKNRPQCHEIWQSVPKLLLLLQVLETFSSAENLYPNSNQDQSRKLWKNHLPRFQK